MAVRKGVSLHALAILTCLGLTLFVCSCFSQTNREDINHYVAQDKPQGYPCPGCGFSIPMENISANIRTKNECPNCGKIFFGTPVAKKTQEYEGKRGEKVVSSGLKSHGPRSVYESDTDYQYFWVGGETFNETETGYSFLFWRFRDSKVKSRRVIPHWTNTRYHYP